MFKVAPPRSGQPCLKTLSVYAGACFVDPSPAYNCEETQHCSDALEFMAMAAWGFALATAMAVVAVVMVVVEAAVAAPPAQAACPLDFSILGKYPCDSSRTECGSCADVWSRLNFVVAEHVRRTGLFLLPAEAAEECMAAFQVQLEGQGLSIKLNSSCGIGSSVLLKDSSSCPDIESVEDYERAVPALQVEQVDEKCTEFSSLPACASCYTAATSVRNSRGGAENCLNFSYIYAAAVVNRAGPLDPWVAFCFFYLLRDSGGNGSQQHRRLIVVSTVVPVAGLLLIILSVLFWFCRRRRKKQQQDEKEDQIQLQRPMRTNAVEFSVEELRAATGGFSAANSIGSGGFGNVFKGVLPDGTQIAVKRFKNCSPAGDAQFVNEVETISSVRHRNLVPLLGWCVHSTASGQHQRFIVYEFMPNGSLLDHRRWMSSWEARKKIVIGVARGLAYLHSGAMPRIIHRDIKSSNILLDAELNARISDLGLARFVPEGISRVMTGVVGTHGYVAPEYVLYEQLTEKSDVYSFGIVLLEILTGKKALMPPSSMPIADWAWNMLKQERNFWDVVVGDADADQEEMERFLAVGFLCAHPYVACRPSMMGALKMLEDGDSGVPEGIPDRPVPIMSSRADVEMLSSGGFQSSTYLTSSMSAR